MLQLKLIHATHVKNKVFVKLAPFQEDPTSAARTRVDRDGAHPEVPEGLGLRGLRELVQLVQGGGREGPDSKVGSCYH